jgi:hypothetical protein
MPKGVYERRPRKPGYQRRAPKLISRPEAMSFQQEHRRLNGVVTWTVTKGEDCYVAQPTVGGRTFRCQLQASELDRLRKLLPPGLTHFPGDGQIVEVWI